MPMKRTKMSILLLVALPVALAVFWLATTSRAATETPAYKVIRSEILIRIDKTPD